MLQEHDEPPLGCAISVVNENVSVYLLLRNVVDASIEIARLQKKQDDLIGQQSALSKRMNTPGYSENVPEAVQEELQAKSSKLFAELESVVEATLNFQKLLIDH
jgi:valyl-tRNA synthetase